MRLRCTICSKEFAEADLPPGVSGCPACGTQSLPCDVAGDVTVKLNWHELRILGIWAENYARSIAAQPEANADSKRAPKVVLAITRRLRAQHPKRPPLTLEDEVAQLRARLGAEVELLGDDGKPLLPKR